MLVEKLLLRLLVGSGQLLLLLLFCQLVLGVSLGPSPLAVLLLVLAVVFPIVGLGMLTAGLAASREQTLGIGLACVFTFAYLGGLWSPIWAASPWVQRLSTIAFTSWAMQGMSDLMLRDGGLEALPVTAGLLFVNGIAFHRARDRAVQLTIRDALSLRPEARRWVVANAGGGPGAKWQGGAGSIR